jgi:hypothetical protein
MSNTMVFELGGRGLVRDPLGWELNITWSATSNGERAGQTGLITIHMTSNHRPASALYNAIFA